MVMSLLGAHSSCTVQMSVRDVYAPYRFKHFGKKPLDTILMFTRKAHVFLRYL